MLQMQQTFYFSPN